MRKLILFTLIVCSSAFADEPYTHIPDVIYGRKYGSALTMDVLQAKGTRQPVPRSSGRQRRMGLFARYDLLAAGETC